MALITCPECGKEVSDKAPVCIHCGYPLQEQKNTKCLINGREYDLGFLLDEEYSYLDKVRDFIQITNCDIPTARNNIDNIISKKSIPKTMHVLSKVQQPVNNLPHCPHCNSTNIQSIGTGERIGSVMMFGMFSKKMNKSFKCLDCKYTW